MGALEQKIAVAARQAGFALAGFARLRRLSGREEFFGRWLAEGRQGEMAYLAREPERRFDPRRLDPRLRSVVSLAYPYAAPPAPAPDFDWRAALRGRIASYALGPDYHDRLIAKAKGVAATLLVGAPGAMARVYVDTGPVFEREWAVEAAMGWFGKNTLLLNRRHGSYFFLAEIFTDVELEPTSARPYRDHCGRCRRCLDLCPTGALGEGYLMDPRLCISYLTIEHRGPIPSELRPRIGNWIFGCDICQEVCPWNEPSAAGAAEELRPYLPALMELDGDSFRHRFGKTAVSRTKRRGLLRNAAVALGNTGNREAVPALARALGSDAEALVRSHAAWALGRLGGADAQRALEQQIVREHDAMVRAEIAEALATMSS